MPDYLGEAHAASTSVSFSLPYGTELVVIFATKADSGASEAPTGATFNSVACTLANSVSSGTAAFETSCAIFYMLRQSLPAGGSSYTAAMSGGSGATSEIIVAAFGGLNQAAPKSTVIHIGEWATALNGLLNDLMVTVVASDSGGHSLSTGGTLIASGGTNSKAAYHVLTADESPHTVTWTGVGEDARDTSVAAMFGGWAGGGAIWL